MIWLPERSNTLLFEMSMQLLFHVITWAATINERNSERWEMR
jgi:hypothetical protein